MPPSHRLITTLEHPGGGIFVSACSVGGHRWSSVVIGGHRWSSVVISPSSRSVGYVAGPRSVRRGSAECTSRVPGVYVAGARSGHRWSSVVIGGHRWSSVVIGGHQSIVAECWVRRGSPECTSRVPGVYVAGPRSVRHGSAESMSRVLTKRNCVSRKSTQPQLSDHLRDCARARPCHSRVMAHLSPQVHTQLITNG